MNQSKAESFSAFLEARQKSKARSVSSTGTALSLLNILADADDKQMAVKDLMSASGMPLIGFADALKTLKDSGYLTVSGRPGEEVAKLTALGEDVSRLSSVQ
jgi:DNA-binding IclR family transcriptional regulator